MVEPQSNPSLLWRGFRVLVMVVCSLAVAYPLAYTISNWQDRKFRAEEVDLAIEMAEHALGPDNPPSPESYFPVTAVSRPPIVKGIKIMSLDEAAGVIEDDELVIGVTINGQSRAYPINVLTGPSREIFNDELGGERIAATW